MKTVRALVLIALFPVTPLRAGEPDCDPAWLPTFGPRPGVVDTMTFFPPIVAALALFDDGTGSALYLGGVLDEAGGVPVTNVTRWNGSAFEPLGAGLNAFVFDFAVFDDGGGPALYSGGSNLMPGSVARWDGAQWLSLDLTVSGGWVNDLIVFDDGSGPALYACGSFSTSDGAPGLNIAKWDGASWSSVGGGLGTSLNSANAMELFDDGTGPALYVAGTFLTAGSVVVNRIAQWDGSSWSALGSGFDDGAGGLAVFDDGSGPALFACGDFSIAGGVATSSIARWDGASWSSFDSGLPGVGARAIAAVDDGTGLTLWAGLDPQQNAPTVYRWNGTAWTSPPGAPVSSATCVFAQFSDANGPGFYVGGEFEETPDLDVHSVVRRQAGAWSPVGSGIGDNVRSLAVHDDGSGPALYAGGQFDSAGGVTLNGIGRWDGAGWSPLGGGLDPANPFLPFRVSSLASFDDGTGLALYAGGRFDLADGLPAVNIARWDGGSWTEVGNGLPGLGDVRALLSYGGQLRAGGNSFATWNGANWVSQAVTGSISALVVFDSGGGPQLYAGGKFTAIGGSPALNLAAYDGATWTPVGVGVGDATSTVATLVVHDDGNGPSLFVGGNFTTAGGVAASRVVRFDGTTWSALGGGADGFVRTLYVHDDGSGSALYAGGDFDVLDGQPAGHIGCWEGASWSALGSGMNGTVWTQAAFDGDLFAGGLFTASLDSGDGHLARWASPCDGPLPYCTAKPSAAGCTAAIGISAPDAQPVSGASDYSVTATGVDAFRSGIVFAGLSGPAALPFLGGTLCVQPPIKKRGPVVSSRGTAPGTCTGAFATLVNDGAVIPSGLDGGPGTSVWYQWWYRDSANGAGQLGTALSNAVQLDFQ